MARRRPRRRRHTRADQPQRGRAHACAEYRALATERREFAGGPTPARGLAENSRAARAHHGRRRRALFFAQDAYRDGHSATCGRCDSRDRGRALRSQLLALLRAARDRGVKLDPEASHDPTVRGWLELGAIATQARGASLTAESDAARWRAEYPNHPALEVLSQALPSPLPPTVIGTRIALLLPLTGPAAGQASTVRDGFLSAYYLLPAASRPELRPYDTGALPGPEAIAQARAAGSSFVVGPLTREDVAAVAATGAQSIPVLALNFLPPDRAAPNGLYQFALSP